MRIDRAQIKRVLSRERLLSLLVLVLFAVVSQGQVPDDSETIKVDSDLVDLRVSVLSLNRPKPLPPLDQASFRILEDGKPQEISFFAAADAPFDLVLLLDLSGSTNKKLKLIRSSAKKFVDATRPADRVSIVTFSDLARTVCPLTLDREFIKRAIDTIEKPNGGTNFWDALSSVHLTLVGESNSRRRAVVVMTDGVDNALPDVSGEGSHTKFEDLLGLVSASETLIFPIYLDTESEERKRHRTPRSAFILSRDQLAQLADACGTRLYRANELKDLDDAYEQVIRDLGRVYSIGYRPSNALRDGKWRAVAVEILDRNDLRARTRRGYYAMSLASQP